MHLPVAGPTSRMLAYAIDALALLVIEIVIVLALVAATPLAAAIVEWTKPFFEGVSFDPESPPAGMTAFILVFFLFVMLFQFVAEMLYFSAWELLGGGRSLGKRVMHLQVVADGGLPLTWRESLVRNVLRIVDTLPSSYLVGLVAMLVSRDGKRLGDLAAGTIVVRLDRPLPALPLEDEPLSAVAQAFRFDRVQIDQLGDGERALIRQTLRRVDDLPAEIGEQVLEQSVETLRQRIGYEAIEPQNRRDFLRALLAAARR